MKQCSSSSQICQQKFFLFAWIKYAHVMILRAFTKPVFPLLIAQNGRAALFDFLVLYTSTKLGECRWLYQEVTNTNSEHAQKERSSNRSWAESSALACMSS